MEPLPANLVPSTPGNIVAANIAPANIAPILPVNWRTLQGSNDWSMKAYWTSIEDACPETGILSASSSLSPANPVTVMRGKINDIDSKTCWTFRPVIFTQNNEVKQKPVLSLDYNGPKDARVCFYTAKNCGYYSGKTFRRPWGTDWNVEINRFHSLKPGCHAVDKDPLDWVKDRNWPIWSFKVVGNDEPCWPDDRIETEDYNAPIKSVEADELVAQTAWTAKMEAMQARLAQAKAERERQRAEGAQNARPEQK